MRQQHYYKDVLEIENEPDQVWIQVLSAPLLLEFERSQIDTTERTQSSEFCSEYESVKVKNEICSDSESDLFTYFYLLF